MHEIVPTRPQCRQTLRAAAEPLDVTMTAQCKFIRAELFALTLAGTVQRSGLYKKETTEKARKPIQVSLRRLLEEMTEDYAEGVSEETHCHNIQHLAEALSDKHADVLTEGGLRIGLAQKALNLYLKYLWCLGEIPEPPHCPIDAVVLRRVPGCERLRWTRMENLEEYLDVIAKARRVAAGVSLAQWELTLYNDAVANPHEVLE